jgi:hypothetical protein
MSDVNEDKTEKRDSRFAEAIGEIAHSQLGYFIGIALFMLAIGISMKWDGHIHDRKGCVEVQEKAGKFFKVDTCTGDIEEINVKSEVK